ncbi:CDP-alcohol phosphatidyltransferase family protein [Spirochaeta lutea]|uniref:CDP-alcohol phosphatidyltransferase family protein n=1 Tax=Spirochaeta lutea TaxID=1480694 RepID=UPI00068AB373|nr:CDP-alcohol phosphatidyltransferase family protein [Spirochaeta lutea]
MEHKKRLTLSIITVTAVLFALQSLIFRQLMKYYGIPGRVLGDYLIVSSITHVLLAVTLLLFRFAFYNVQTGERVDYINLPNAITMVRISSTPAILFLLFLNMQYPVIRPLIIYTVVAFISDLLDGNVSRRTKQVTKIGAYLDSMSDYGVLIAVSVAFLYFDLVTFAFFLLVMVRFLVQWIGMGIVTLINRKWADHRSSFLGKASVFATMSLYGVALLKLIPRAERIAIETWFPYAEAFVAVVLIISLLEKLAFLFHDIQDAKKARGNPGP